MTELPQDGEPTPENGRLHRGEVEVYFADEQQPPVILETATPKVTMLETALGLYELEELILPDGQLLTPSRESPDQRIGDFAEYFYPVIRPGVGALLRTVMYRQEEHHQKQFLDVVGKEMTDGERDIIRADILRREDDRTPDILAYQLDFLDDYFKQDFWIRLEAIHDPEKALMGKLIMARLAYFKPHEEEIGITPIIYSEGDNTLVSVPTQLTLNETWLYHRFDAE